MNASSQLLSLTKLNGHGFTRSCKMSWSNQQANPLSLLIDLTRMSRAIWTEICAHHDGWLHDQEQCVPSESMCTRLTSTDFVLLLVDKNLVQAFGFPD